MKHLIACIFLIILGLLTRLMGAILLQIVPSMASVDDVLPRFHAAEDLAWLLYIALPYLIAAVMLARSHRKNRLTAKTAYTVTLTLLFLPPAALLTLHFAGLPIIAALPFWWAFPALHAATVVLLYRRGGGKAPAV